MGFTQILDGKSLITKWWSVFSLFLASLMSPHVPVILSHDIQGGWQLSTNVAQWTEAPSCSTEFISTQYKTQYYFDTSLRGHFPFAAQGTTRKGTENEESKREQ